VIAYKKDEVFSFGLVKIQFISRQAGETTLVKDYLGRKIDGVYLTYLLCSQHMDHILGDKLTNLTDSGEPFNKNRIDKFSVPYRIKKADGDLLDHFFAILRYFPYRSSIEKRAG
jgi:hypothetical protein